MVSKNKGAKSRSTKRIEDERKRKVTLKKRAQCIMKKALELATLCGVQVLVAIFRPTGEVEIWPENWAEVKDIIKKEKDYRNSKRRRGVVIEEIHDDDDDSDPTKKRTSSVHEEAHKVRTRSEDGRMYVISTPNGKLDEKSKELLKKLWNWDMSMFSSLERKPSKELLKFLEVKIGTIEVRIKSLEIMERVILTNPRQIELWQHKEEPCCIVLDASSNNEEELVKKSTSKGKEIVGCDEERRLGMINSLNCFDLCQLPSSSTQPPLSNFARIVGEYPMIRSNNGALFPALPWITRNFMSDETMEDVTQSQSLSEQPRGLGSGGGINNGDQGFEVDLELSLGIGGRGNKYSRGN